MPHGQAFHLYEDPVMWEERFILMCLFPCGCHVPKPQGLDCGFPTDAFYKIHTACFPLHRYIWFPQGPWGHMVQFTGIFYCSLDVLQGSFLFWFYLKLASFHVIQSTGGEICLVWNVLSLEIKEVYQMLCFFVVGDARWSHLSFTLRGNPKVYSGSLDT